MTDDYRTERVFGVPRATEFPQQHDTPQRRGYQAYAAQPPEPVQHSIHDVASVLGLDVETIDPAVVAAVLPLLAEIDRLRHVALQNEHRRAYVERAADRHSVVPCLNRRAFVREMEGVIQSGEPFGTLAVLHFGGIEHLCRVHGMAAAEGGLRHAAAAITGAIRTGDILGCLVGSDFGLLLVGTDLAAAQTKLAEISSRLNQPAFCWLGQPVALECHSGAVSLTAGEGGEQALAAADRVRRGLSRD